MPGDLAVALQSASQDWSGGTPSGAQLRATRAFLATAEHDPALLKESAALMHDGEPGAAAWIAVCCGTLVERGASAELTGPAVFDLLRSWFPRLPTGTVEPTPEQSGLLVLFQFVCQSTVTHLARLPAQRDAMGRDASLLGRLNELSGFSHGAIWVWEALRKSSGSLILLHPQSSSGLRLKYTNVSNCFHLFSLLQTAVGSRIPGGRAPVEAIALSARGRSSEILSDEAWWHYGSAMSNKADIKASIWGEGTVREIPQVDGQRLILAWQPILQTRTWDAGFLGPHLDAMPADVTVEGALTQAEVDAWLARLGIDPASRQRKWWRLW